MQRPVLVGKSPALPPLKIPGPSPKHEPLLPASELKKLELTSNQLLRVVVENSNECAPKDHPSTCSVDVPPQSLLSATFQTKWTASGCTRLSVDLFAGGLLETGSIPSLDRLGIKTVVNLLLPGNTADPQVDAIISERYPGTTYFMQRLNETLYPTPETPKLNEYEVDNLLGILDLMEKPVLLMCSDVHCSTAVCLAYNETRRRTHLAALQEYGEGKEEAHQDVALVPHLPSLRRLSALSLWTTNEDAPNSPSSNQSLRDLQELLIMYVDKKVASATQRRKVSMIFDGVFVGGQPTEHEIRNLHSVHGFKTVVCVRSDDEIGQFGLGVMCKEKALVESLGMKFVNIEVHKSVIHAENSEEILIEKVKEMASLEQPIFVHSAMGERAEKIGQTWQKHRAGMLIPYQSIDGRAPEATWTQLFLVLLVSAAMGLAFGAAMESGKVVYPAVIRQQFLFQRFIMLKMFLSAAGASAFFLSLCAVFAPDALLDARDLFMGCGCGKGLFGIGLGTALLGSGMAIAGACPGMVMVQVGCGVPNSGFTLLGGMCASLIYGLFQPWIAPHLVHGKISQVRAEDFSFLSKFSYKTMAMGLAIMLGVIAGLFEYFFTWTDSVGSGWWAGDLPRGLVPWRQAWPPTLSGLLIGFLQVPCVVLLGDTLGSSSAYMTMNAQLLLTPGLQQRFRHLNGFRTGAGNLWQLVYILFAILGSGMSSSVTGTMSYSKGVPIPQAFIGGFIMIFGSRMASGCTSGHGLSGMALLSVQSIFAVPCMFGGGIITAFIWNAITPTFISDVAMLSGITVTGA